MWGGRAAKDGRKEPAARPGTAPVPKLARKALIGVGGGRRHACPYCDELFEITVPRRPITITCPWCSYEVSVVE